MKLTRAEALAAGETFYDTKKPCKRGHLSRRFAGSGTCYDCYNISQKKFNEARKLIKRDQSEVQSEDEDHDEYQSDIDRDQRIRIKGWSRFQHFKDRRPPWIKLYRDLLDDPEFFRLDAECVRTLILLWLIASQEKEKDGLLPPLDRIAFRIRKSVEETSRMISMLSHWVISPSHPSHINPISCGYRLGLSESEAEAKKEIRGREKTCDVVETGEGNLEEKEKDLRDRFELEIWKPYPARDGRKIGKAEAFLKYKKLAEPDKQLLVTALRHLLDHPSTKREVGIKDLHRWIRDGKGIEHWREWIEATPTQHKGGNEHVGLDDKDYSGGRLKG